MDKIDRTKPNQRMMILTLPLANQIVERLKRSGWTQTYRCEDLVKLEARGNLNVLVRRDVSPEGINVPSYDKDESDLFDVFASLTEEFWIGDAIKSKMQSVIGIPEYFRGTDNGRAVWYWTFRDYTCHTITGNHTSRSRIGACAMSRAVSS